MGSLGGSGECVGTLSFVCAFCPPPPHTHWTEKGGQEQFSDAESILIQRYEHYVGPNEI